MTLVKICGITNIADAIEASKLGADMLGFVFYGRSKRYVGPDAVREIAGAIPCSVLKVGVFVDEDKDKARDIASRACLDALQFHGDETPEYCASFKAGYKVIKAFRLRDRADLKSINLYDVDLYLIDTYKSGEHGGTGEMFDWKILKDFHSLRPIILSGGLNPGNVARAILEAAPYGVDVSTGVERSPGEKDARLVSEFIRQARKV